MDSNTIYRFDELEYLFPKCMAEFKTFATDLLRQQNFAEELIEEAVKDLCTFTVNSANPIFYQFLDHYKIYVVIDCMDYIDGKEWIPMVVNTELEIKETRIEAMILAFNEAFVILEKQLENESSN